MISTPNRDTAKVMQAIKSLNINGRQHPVNAYVTAGEDTTRGVIHGIEAHTPSDVLRSNLRIRTQGLELIDARMMGDSQSALLTFYGSRVQGVFITSGRETLHTLPKCGSILPYLWHRGTPHRRMSTARRTGVPLVRGAGACRWTHVHTQMRHLWE